MRVWSFIYLMILSQSLWAQSEKALVHRPLNKSRGLSRQFLKHAFVTSLLSTQNRDIYHIPFINQTISSKHHSDFLPADYEILSRISDNLHAVLGDHKKQYAKAEKKFKKKQKVKKNKSQDQISQSPKAIVILHGVNADASSMEAFEKFLNYKYPQIYVKNMEIGEGIATSSNNLWRQIELFRDEIYKDRFLEQGFDIVAHSQGGIISRSYVQLFNHDGGPYNVDKLITWGSPHSGTKALPWSGEGNFLIDSMDWFATHIIPDLSYANQDNISFFQLWRNQKDLHKHYRKGIFLPFINNEIPHDRSEMFKKNLSTLKKLVLFKSHNEKVVRPASSCWFFLRPEGMPVVEDIHECLYHQADLNLEGLQQRGTIYLEEAHSSHTTMTIDLEVWKKTLEHLMGEVEFTIEDHAIHQQGCQKHYENLDAAVGIEKYLTNLMRKLES